MIIASLLLACAGDTPTPNDYSLALCEALNDCGLFDAYDYTDVNECTLKEEEKFAGYDLNDEHATNCLEMTIQQTCADIIELNQPDSCSLWFVASDN